MRLAQRRVLPPRTRTAMLVTADLAGQVLVTPYNRLHKHHRCQTARGLAVVVPGQRFSVKSLTSATNRSASARELSSLPSARSTISTACSSLTTRHRLPRQQKRC